MLIFINIYSYFNILIIKCFIGSNNISNVDEVLLLLLFWLLVGNQRWLPGGKVLLVNKEVILPVIKCFILLQSLP